MYVGIPLNNMERIILVGDDLNMSLAPEDLAQVLICNKKYAYLKPWVEYQVTLKFMQGLIFLMPGFAGKLLNRLRFLSLFRLKRWLYVHFLLHLNIPISYSLLSHNP